MLGTHTRNDPDVDEEQVSQLNLQPCLVPHYFGPTNKLSQVQKTGTGLLGLADLVWLLRYESFWSGPFRSGDISVKTFLYINN